MATIDRPLQHPDRSMRSFRPLKALGHFRRLVADKEDTEQVFHIIEALKGPRTARQARDFVLSDTGQALIREDRDIPAMLDDHARWQDLPPESVGAHYLRFMKREGLTAAGLVEESYKWLPREQRPQDLYEWYFERLRDTHDLFHILSGYGRDALGEVCLLGFSYSQNHNRGVQFIAWAGARQMKRESGTAAPIYAALKEGLRLGRDAAKLAHENIEALMREPLEDARERLNIGKPATYRECLAVFEAEGLTAQEVMAA